MEPLQLCDSTVRFKVETGADVSVISEATLKLLDKPTLKPTTVVLKSPGGRLKCPREFTTTAICKGKQYELDIVVIEGNKADQLTSP